MNLYPQTDLNNRNLGWIIDEIKKLQEEIANGGIQVVSMAAQMTNHAVIYVYIGSESGMNNDHWYYWDNPSQTWVDGGAWGGGAVVLPLAISDGGTGSTTASAARSALGITPANIGAVSTSATINISHGGTGSTTAAAARTALGITPANIGAVSTSDTIPVNRGGTGSTTAAAARTALGITPANIGAEPAITTLPLTKGGTGATTAAGARTALGITPANIGAEPAFTVLPVDKGGTGVATVADIKSLLDISGTFKTLYYNISSSSSITIDTVASERGCMIFTGAGTAERGMLWFSVGSTGIFSYDDKGLLPTAITVDLSVAFKVTLTNSAGAATRLLKMNW